MTAVITAEHCNTVCVCVCVCVCNVHEVMNCQWVGTRHGNSGQ